VLHRIVDAHEKRGAAALVPLRPYGGLEYSSWVGRVGATTARAGTLDQQRATIERVSKEIGALADLVEANEAKGRMGQVRAS
jgi:hypothetical protein